MIGIRYGERHEASVTGCDVFQRLLGDDADHPERHWPTVIVPRQSPTAYRPNRGGIAAQSATWCINDQRMRCTEAADRSAEVSCVNHSSRPYADLGGMVAVIAIYGNVLEDILSRERHAISVEHETYWRG